ncbi:MAG: hypothetical protein AAF962_13520 [Actinomycetota bacterium]
MTLRTFTPVLLLLALLLAACGSDDDTPVDAGAGTPSDPAPGISPDDATDSDGADDNGATGVSPSDEDPPGPDGADGETPSDEDPPRSDGAVIGEANIGGEVVDPKPHPIDDLAIAESYPEQLGISFTAGDENCLAADATAEVVGDEVVVTLLVGITTDALTKSCLAGEFQHTITIPLTQGLDGRDVVLAP